MGEGLRRFAFNRAIHVETDDARISGCGGALLLREIDEHVGLTREIASSLIDPRDPLRVEFSLEEQLRTLVYLIGLGWTDLDDVDTLRADPALGLAVASEKGTQAVSRGLPSQPTLSRMMDLLACEKNRPVLHEALAAHAVGAFVRRHKRGRDVVIDVDSFPAEVHGHQSGARHNGHYHCTMYHPLVVAFGDTGDILAIELRPGNVHTADGAEETILEAIDVVRLAVKDRILLRFDAGFPSERLLAALEARGVFYVGRVRNNKNLDARAAPLLVRPRGRPPKNGRTFAHELLSTTKAWSRERRLVLAVQEHPPDELKLLSHFWLVTNLPVDVTPAHVLVAIYRQRGTAEGRFGDFKSTMAPTLSSTRRRKLSYRNKVPRTWTARHTSEPMHVNEARLVLYAIAAALMRHVERVVADKAIRSLRRVRERVLAVAVRVVSHARRLRIDIDSSVARYWDRFFDGLRPRALLA